MAAQLRLIKHLEKKLGGNYTRMLHAILNKSWKQHPTKHQMYGHLLPISQIIQIRWARHTGHWWKSKDKLIKDILLGTPKHGHTSIGRQTKTFINQLCEDIGCCLEDLPIGMDDKKEPKESMLLANLDNDDKMKFDFSFDFNGSGFILYWYLVHCLTFYK